MYTADCQAASNWLQLCHHWVCVSQFVNILWAQQDGRLWTAYSSDLLSVYSPVTQGKQEQDSISRRFH